MAAGKKEIKELRKALSWAPRRAHDALPAEARAAADAFCDGYRAFLDAAKTERLAVRAIERAATTAGFKPLSAKARGGKFFTTYRGKAVALAVLGDAPIDAGVNLVVSHVDSPRLDLKQKPLYEEYGIAYLKTHYYGGLRKHQWVARPLALHGVVVKRDGELVEIALGEDPAEPCLLISDLLPHLAAGAQGAKKFSDAIPGEKLNVICGGRPLGEPEDGKDRVKLHVLKLLHEKYGLVEEDLASAELEIVPAGAAREVGLDRAFIGAYGQDDRVCAYTGLRALLDLAAKPARPAIALFMDKEEIGSYGNTGADARFFLDFVGELLAREGKGDERSIRRALAASQALSADVTAALDPDWTEVHDKHNAALAGGGICMSKYGGTRGKSGSSDANAEFVGKVRRILNDAGVPWQSGELGKIDEGGGGTVALYFASFGIDVLDIGPALLAVHSPCELAHKDDVYSSYLAYKAFFEKA